MSSSSPPVLRWQIGDVRISSVLEQTTTAIGRWVLPQATPEELGAIPWLRPHFVDDESRIIMAIQSFLVEVEDRRILVDTCVGNDKERRFRQWNQMRLPYLERLAEAGASPESIDTVLCTHLHVDHVGWNTRLENGRWVPTFGKARYLIGEDEWDYWKDRPEDPDPTITDSVRPIFDAGLADLIQPGHAVADGITLEPTPGHTPGHVSVRISSRGEEAWITGDCIHHPSQLVHPEWAPPVDVDAERARETRIAFLERVADQPTLVIGSHFAAPTGVRVVRDGEVFRLAD